MPRPFYRSPVLWFALPGLVFLIFGWVDSMSYHSSFQGRVSGRPVNISNGNGTFGISWNPDRTSSMVLDLSSKRYASRPGASWFPLPSYVATNYVGTSTWHHLNVSYWFAILAYLGLWQLPWLWRYHRRRKIERTLTAAPPPSPS
jgi:hypothetical protein